MIASDVFRHVPVLHGDGVRLEPLTDAVFDDYVAAIGDPEVRRLTGSHADHDHEVIRKWLATRAEHHDRADWAAVRTADDAFLGEVVLNNLDPDNASVDFRIMLGPHAIGRGYGTQVTRLAVGHGFAVGLHRIGLGVYAFNPRAQRVYEKCGFVVEGTLRDTLWWDGEWHDELRMAVLNPSTSTPSAPGRDAGAAPVRGRPAAGR